MRRLRARTASRRYAVVIGRGCLAALGVEARRVSRGRQAVVVTDANVAPFHLEPAAASLRGAGFAVSHVVLPSGEQEKTLVRAEELYGVLYDRGVRRDDVVVALGGGVVGDLAGFVAATYQRGTGFVQAPTTLLAQVDAAIGGKVAVDFRAGKNYVGCFYQPLLVLEDLATLATLPARELRNGAAEVVKHGLLAGGEALRQAERLAAGPLTPARVSESLVAASVAVKLAVVAADEREAGRRAVLNLGHTLGHAIEAAGRFRLYSHGEAVALGLRAALWLSERLAGLSPRTAARAAALLDRLGLPRRLEGLSVDDVLALVPRDKKAAAAGVGFVLLRAPGRPVRGVTVPEELQREVLTWLTRG